jgi:large subunit ribosomal protein L6
MSRIGKLPIEVPDKVDVGISGSVVSVKGPKGAMEIVVGEGIAVELVDNLIQVSCKSTKPQAKANFGTARALVNNMVQGVTTGWSKKLILSGVGYNAKQAGSVLTLNVGYSHEVNLDVPDKVECKAAGTSIELESVDRELLGTFAAKVRAVCPPEPYLGKGIRYDNEVVRRKAGKTGR